MNKTLTAVSLVLLGLSACQTAAPEPALLTDADRAAIDAKSQEFATAIQAGDWAGAAAVFTEDAMVMPPNAPAVTGRSAIEASLRSMPPVVSFALTNTEVNGSGDIAYVVGTYSMTLTPPGVEPIREVGKYIEIRKKQADGSWLVHRDISNSDIPAAPAAPRRAAPINP